MEQGSGKANRSWTMKIIQAVRKRLGGEQASGMAFANLPKTAPEGYQQCADDRRGFTWDSRICSAARDAGHAVAAAAEDHAAA